MGIGSILNRANIFRSSTTAGPPSTLTGAPPVPGRLIRNADGSATDPVTGQTYVADGKGGLTAAAMPNVAEQAGAAAGRATDFYGNAADVFGQQQSLADTLRTLAAGTGPSVAGTQNAIALDQAQKQQLSQAAGASGNNAALAHMNAMANTGALAANANQTGVLGRTAEEMGAINALGGLTGQMEGQQLGAGDTLSNLAMGGAKTQEELQYQAAKDKADAENADKAHKRSAIGSIVNAGAKLIGF